MRLCKVCFGDQEQVGDFVRFLNAHNGNNNNDHDQVLTGSTLATDDLMIIPEVIKFPKPS